MVRNRLRHLRGIEGSMTMDILCFSCCGCCVIIQDAQEIEECKKAGMPTGNTVVSAVVQPQVHYVQQTAMARQ